MKKKLMIGFIIIIFISILSFGVYIYLDLNKPLTCSKGYVYEGIEVIEKITAEFDKTKIKKITGEFEMNFASQVEASGYYSNYKDKQNLIVKGNKISYFTDETKTLKKSNKNRYDLKKSLQGENLGYICK